MGLRELTESSTSVDVLDVELSVDEDPSRLRRLLELIGLDTLLGPEPQEARA